MTNKILEPGQLSPAQLEQIIELINSGGQIQVNDLKTRLLNADLIAIKEDKDLIICTAALKNPLKTYITNVFNDAKATNTYHISKELGYIATHCDYENKGHCKDLMSNFYPYLSDKNLFATTRKSSMIHILGKFQFKPIGSIYKKDLQLLTHYPKAEN